MADLRVANAPQAPIMSLPVEEVCAPPDAAAIDERELMCLDKAEPAPAANPFQSMLSEPAAIEAKAAPKTHDEKVQELITSYIDKANADPLKGSTVAERLHSIRSDVISDRQKDSTDPVLRDVEYYFCGRAHVSDGENVASKGAIATGGALATIAYNALKATVGSVSDVMESDKGLPTSKPGGFDWVNRGSYDGFSTDGKSMGPIEQLRKPAAE